MSAILVPTVPVQGRMRVLYVVLWIIGTKLSKKRIDVRGGSKSNISNKLPIIGLTASSRPTVRTFNIIVKKAVALRDVVSGIIPINSIDAYVLFDSCDTW